MMISMMILLGTNPILQARQGILQEGGREKKKQEREQSVFLTENTT